MSRGFIKEGDQEEIPMMPPRAYLPEGVPNYVTKEGLAALNEELKELEAERLKAGDNYIMGNFIDAKMKLLISRISSAVEVDLLKANKDVVSFGAWVRYNGHVVRIVGVDEADVKKGLVAFTSPIAKALMGKRTGDVVALKGTEGLVVEAVSYEPMDLTQMVQESPLETTASQEKRSLKTTGKTIEQLVQAPQLPQDDDINLPCKEDELPIKEELPIKKEEPPLKELETPLFEPEVNPMEFLPVVNERGIIVGRALYVELHQGNKMLHPVVHLHVFNGKGETVRRYWWHVAFGETPEKTLKRKMAETLGLSGVKPVLKRQYVREAKNEKELVYVFTIVSEEDLPVTPDQKEYTEFFEKD